MYKIQSVIITSDGHNVRYYWIPGFADVYVIGDDGSLWTRNQKVGWNWVLSNDWRKMYPVPNGEGYIIVGLRFNGVRYMKTIHQMVCEAEYGPCPVGMEVCHNDGIRTNNNWWNLRYDTLPGNQADRVIHGTDNRGENNPSAKRTWKEVREIREKYASGKYTYENLALEYGAHKDSVGAIVRYEQWIEEEQLSSTV